MILFHCLNPLSQKGIRLLGNDTYLAVEDASKADAIFVRSFAMHNLPISPLWHCVARAGAGVNNIPIEACSHQGVVVFNTPGANANGVKELVLAGLLLATRDIVGGINWVQKNKDESGIAKIVESNKARFAGTELAHKSIGIIGLGAIGVLVANVLTRLGMHVYGYDPYISIDHAWSLSRSVIRVGAIDDIYRHCDFISLHLPLCDETKCMVNAQAFQKMKEDVVLINFARDSLVDDKALASALQSKKVKKYVTDFPNDAVVHLENVIAIPHLGASTEESEENCAIMAVEQVKDYLENGNIKNSVNFPDCDAGICQSKGRIAINHLNVPNMINKITVVFQTENINISHLINKSKKELAYTLLDVDSETNLGLCEKLMLVEGVLRVRCVK